MTIRDLPWRLAEGSCGLNVGDLPVYAAYVNGVALFAFEHRPWWWNCVVVGCCTASGPTLETAMRNGEFQAHDWDRRDRDRRLTREQFLEIVSNPERLS